MNDAPVQLAIDITADRKQIILQINQGIPLAHVLIDAAGAGQVINSLKRLRKLLNK